MNSKYNYILLTLILLALLSCAKEEKVPKEIIRPVRYQQVFLGGGEITRTFSGISKAGTEAKLSFRVSGNVQSVKVKVGDKIRKNGLISQIDDSDARLQTEKAQVAMEKSRIQKETSKSNLDRVKELYENNSAPLSEYETAKANYASANSVYNADKTNVDLQKSSMSYYELYSPIDGIVTQVNVEQNENAQAGQVIAVINAEEDIEVTVGIPGGFISKVNTGEMLSVRFISIPGQVFDGKITEISYSISSETSTYPVIIALTHPTREIRPGMPADVVFSFTSEIQSESIIVPVNAVGEDSQGNFVYTMIATENGLGKILKKTVIVGSLSGEGFEVLSGLQDGEYVVTAGISHLSDGMKVRMLK